MPGGPSLEIQAHGEEDGPFNLVALKRSGTWERTSSGEQYPYTKNLDDEAKCMTLFRATAVTYYFLGM